MGLSTNFIVERIQAYTDFFAPFVQTHYFQYVWAY
jgi:hypothetical protein